MGDEKRGHPLLNRVVTDCKEYQYVASEGDKFMCHEVPSELLEPWEKLSCDTLDKNTQYVQNEHGLKMNPKDLRCVPNHYLSELEEIYFDVDFQNHSRCKSGEPTKEGVECYSENLRKTLQNEAENAANRFGEVIGKKFIRVEKGDKRKNLTVQFTADNRLPDEECGVAPRALDRARKIDSGRDVRINYHAFHDNRDCHVMEWKGVLMHELAHKFGVQHAEYAGWRSALMFPYYKDLQNNIFGERYLNSFAVDDINRIQANNAIIKKEDFEERLKRKFEGKMTDSGCETLTGAETIGETEDESGREY